MIFFKNKVLDQNVTRFFLNRRKKIWVPVVVHVFGFTKGILDPEFSFWLFSLNVLSVEKILLINFCYSQSYKLSIFFCPTSLVCSLTPIIGLSIGNLLFNDFLNLWLRNLTPCNWILQFTLDITNFSHSKREEIVKQLNDKERVSAAFENFEIRKTVLGCYEH
mmetsp:Transcript_100197/g.150229  ORF Transcript_100197/g.150229 Transcript_100197/m.150229 type:complete len:163 (+) Transcript_100197:657-1145(+)